jgi:hypothetical protein
MQHAESNMQFEADMKLATTDRNLLRSREAAAGFGIFGI